MDDCFIELANRSDIHLKTIETILSRQDDLYREKWNIVLMSFLLNLNVLITEQTKSTLHAYHQYNPTIHFNIKIDETGMRHAQLC